MSLTNAFSRSAVLPVLFPAVLLSAGFAAGQTTTADYRYLPAEQRQNTAVQTLYVPNPGTAAPIQQMQYRTEFSPGMVQRFPQPDGNVSHAAQPVPVLPPVLPPADPFIGTGLPANAPTGNASPNHAANHVVPIPAQIPPFAPIQHPQLRQFDSPQQTPVAFTEAAPEPPADAARISMMPLPKPENTEQPAPVPASPSPQILPVKTNAAETATKVHRLQLPIAVFEKNLIEKLGSKFVPVRNVDNSPNSSRYRLPVRDGSEVELILDVQSNSAVITGSAKTAEACLQIVRLLDTEPRKGIVAEFVPVQQSSLPAVQRTADILNRETLRFAQANPPAANPLAGTIQPLPPPAAGNNSDNGNSNGNGNGNNAAAGIDVNPGKVLGPVQINIIDAGGMEMMNITGSPEDVQVIKNMLKQLETMSLEHEPIIELIPVKHADSLRVSQIVQQLYTQVYQQRRGSVTMLPLVKPNTILLIGKKESNDAAKELIAKLDTAVNPNASFQIFRLKHAASDTLATQMTQSFAGRPGTGNGLAPQVSIVSDFRTNSLIVQGSPRDINEAAAMIRQLDVSGSDITNIVRTFPLKNAIASELATTLTNAFAGRSGGSTTGAFGGGGATGNTGSRGAVLSFGQVDKDGNLIRGSVLYDVTVVADTRSNTLLVTAPPETMSLIEAVIRQLDQLPSAQSKIKVFQLANGDAYALTTMLTNLFSATSTGGFGGGTAAGTSSIATVRPGIEPGESTLVSVRFQTDIRTNSIIAVGSEGDMAVAEALLLRLDTDSANNRKVMLLKLINTPADQIAPILQQYVANERQIDIQNSTTILPHSPLEQYLKEINVVAEPISNSLIISTTPRYYNQIRKIVRELDERPLMVAIQVLIAEVRMNSNKERGIEIGLQDSLLFDRSMAAAGIPGFLFRDTSVDMPTGNVASNRVGTQGITSLGVNRAHSPGIGGFTFSASSESVSMLIRALETQDKIRVLSRPQLVTLHNLRAQIHVGQDVPFVSGTSATNGTTQSQTEWRQVGTILDITPRIMPDGMVSMAVLVERSSMGSEADGVPLYESGGTLIKQPKVNSTNAQTTINAHDGQTVVFAGLISEQKETVNRSVPVLNKIPLVRHAFEYDSTVNQRSELLIILTPTIIRKREDLELLKQQETARMHWCINDVVKLTGNSNMRLRSDEWLPSEMNYRNAPPMILNESQLPPENKIPVPLLAPAVEK